MHDYAQKHRTRGNPLCQPTSAAGAAAPRSLSTSTRNTPSRTRTRTNQSKRPRTTLRTRGKTPPKRLKPTRKPFSLQFLVLFFFFFSSLATRNALCRGILGGVKLRLGVRRRPGFRDPQRRGGELLYFLLSSFRVGASTPAFFSHPPANSHHTTTRLPSSNSSSAPSSLLFFCRCCCCCSLLSFSSTMRTIQTMQTMILRKISSSSFYSYMCVTI